MENFKEFENRVNDDVAPSWAHKNLLSFDDWTPALNKTILKEEPVQIKKRVKKLSKGIAKPI